MKILIVNPNTSTAVTERFVAEARTEAPEDVDFVGVTGRFGAGVVSTRAEDVVAAHAALELIARHHAGYDAAILAISFDSGARALADVSPIPIIPLTASAIAAGLVLARGGQVGLVLFGAMSRVLYEDLIDREGLRTAIAGIGVVEVDSAKGYLAPEAHDAAVVAAVGELAVRGAAAAVICGAAIVGIARRIASACPIPVTDSAAPAVSAAVAAASAPREIRVPPPVLAPMTGVDPTLAALIAPAPAPSSPALP